MRRRRIAWVAALACGMAYAQGPTITAVQDAGGYTANLAPGIVFVVKGSNLCGTSATANAIAAPYSTAALGGATVRLTPVAGGAGIDAFMIYCFNNGSVTQLAAELPNSTATGDYNVTVTFNGSTSAAFKTTVVARKFQVLSQAGSGSGRTLAQNVVSSSQYDINSYTTSASRSPGKPSEFLIAAGTGLGAAVGYDASAPPNGLDFIATQNLDVKAIVGGMEITPSYAGRSNQFPGLDYIGFQLPANVTTGCNVPFQVRVAGQLSNETTISIAPDAQSTACVGSQFSPDVLTKLDAGGSIVAGFFDLTSYASNFSFGGQNFAVRAEGASGAFAKYTADTVTELPNLTPSGTGTCQVYQTTSSTAGGGANTNLTYLDAGNITLNGPNVSNKAFTKTSNVYTLNLGLSGSGLPPGIPGFNASPLITAGTYALAGAGGADIGAFNASITINTPLTITGGLPSTVNRSQNLNIAWTGGGSTDVVLIAGTSSLLVSGTPGNGTYSTTTFICTTTADKQSFSVPSSILMQLPATPSGNTGAGTLSVYSTSTPTNGNGLFSAPLTAGGTTDFALFTAGIGSSGTPTYQ